MLLFALVLLIAGGIIAYVGDRLGTYIGKKRLSAWGLRPRHTAMLYTVLSGGLIAVLTLFALIGYDKTVQKALLQGAELLEKNDRLTSQNRQQTLLIRSREAQVQAADARAVAAQARAYDAGIQARDAIARAGTALHLAHGVEERLHHSLERLHTAQAALNRSRDALLQRQVALAAARHRLARLNGSLGNTQAELRAARASLHGAQRAVQDADNDVRQAQSQYYTAESTVADLTNKGKDLAARNADLTRQSTALEAKNQQLLTQTTFLQLGHLLYHKGQELGRRVILTGLSADAVRQDLVAFLDDLSHEAERQGANRGDNGRAVVLVAGEQNGKVVSEDEALDALAQSIAQQSGSIPGVVVIADARYNTFGGEPVEIQIQPYDNVLVFAKGALVDSTVVDGSLPEDQILEALGAFLKDRVQTAARRQGIIPRPDPKTGEPTVGEPTDSTQTLALVKQIQQIGPGALITARAAADTYSSGPLRLDLTASAPPPTVPAVPPATHPPSPVPFVGRASRL